MELTTLVSRLDERLNVGAYEDADPSANGLQIGPPEQDVTTVATAVDAAQATIEAAADHDADLLIAHHGLIFGGLGRITGQTHETIASALTTDLAVYGVHLPLDGHQELGNAAQLATRLDLTKTAPFGTVGGEPIGQRGRLPEATTRKQFTDRLAAAVGGENRPRLLPFGPERITSVGIITGSGTDWIEAAAAADLDAFVTGEGKQAAYHTAREHGLNVYLAGHYATETAGVQAVGDELTSWGLETTFIDHPTGF